jgi:hypothetical protein
MALSRTWQEFVVERRPEDGYFNATAAGAIFQKHPKHFLGTSQTKAYIVAVAEALRLDTGFDETPNTAVFMTQHGGTTPGTWFHPRLMLHYARWLDPHFAVWMDSWVIDVLGGQRLVATPPAPQAQTVARRQEAARPQPLYRNQLCILNETDLHVAVVAEIRAQHPEAVLVAGIGELPETVERRRMAGKMGYQAGQPDLLILNNGSNFCGLALEFKHPGFELEGAVNPVQTNYHRALEALGWKVLAVNSFAAALREVDAYMRAEVQIMCRCCRARWKGQAALDAHMERKRRKRGGVGVALAEPPPDDAEPPSELGALGGMI